MDAARPKPWVRFTTARPAHVWERLRLITQHLVDSSPAFFRYEFSQEGNTEEALACLLRAEQADPRLPNLHLRIGETYMRRQQLDDAERAFRRALEIDGDSAEAHLGLAQVMLRKRMNEDAAEESLVAVGLQHFLPLGHYVLGVALARLGHPHRATVAFETSVAMLPGLVNGHRWLAALQSQPGGDREKATAHRKIASDLLKRRREQLKAVASDK